MNSATISMDQIISVLLLLNSCGVRTGSDPACYMCSCCSSQVRVNWKSVSWAGVRERVLAGAFVPDWNSGVCFERKRCYGRKCHVWQTQEEILIFVSSMEMRRGCSYKISLRHASGCVRAWTRILQCSWAWSVWTPLSPCCRSTPSEQALSTSGGDGVWEGMGGEQRAWCGWGNIWH